jgi:adenosine deaminase
VEAAIAQAVQTTGVEARLILCTLRNYSTEHSLETVHLVEDFQDTYVAGFDIAADTDGNPIAPHIEAFKFARDAGIPCTAHAGEVRGPGHVWETLGHFTPLRIGHGVRSIEDSVLLDHLRDQQIHLEVCPTSNIQTNVYDTIAEHPIDKLYQAGLSIGINTDARTITDTTLSEEYGKLHNSFRWDTEEFYRCNLNALEAAFLPEDVRNDLKARLADGYEYISNFSREY